MLLTGALIVQLEKLPGADRAGALLALLEFCRVCGEPHLESDLEFRKIGRHEFECVAGSRWRLIVCDMPDCWRAWFIGDRSDIGRLLRARLIL